MPDKNVNISERIKNGDEEAFHHLYRQYKPILLVFARNTVQNALLAEDFVQDAFCTLWEKRSDLKTDQPVHRFLYKLVYSRCVDYLRKQRAKANYNQWIGIKLRELELQNFYFEDLIISGILTDEAQSIIQNTMNNLPEHTRDIFRLSRDNGFKNAEIAKVKGLSVKAVEYHISRALEQLRNSLAEFL
jgi:RNA polymerase sigma-70 factor (family 1)